MLKYRLDKLEERREHAQIRNVAYQQRAARDYNSHTRVRRFMLSDLVRKRVAPRTKDKSTGSLANKWEWPYHIIGIARHGAYHVSVEEELANSLDHAMLSI